MNSFVQMIQSGVSNVVPMVVLLGLLIFVHELGHFLVAKYNKVRVEVFSLGFGPKILKYRKGDTTYALSAIPLGGYVKMFGDDPTADVSAEDKEHSFLHKRVGQRISVVLAGPLMNFFFAILLFTIIAMIGEPSLAPKLGDLKEDSAAYKAGFRSGDTITAINGEKIQTWEQMQKEIEENPDHALQIDVTHDATLTDTAAKQITTTPLLTENKNIMSWQSHVGDVDGLNYNSRASAIGIPDPKSAAASAGLKSGDLIVSINEVKVDKWRDIAPALAKLAQAPELKFSVQRDWNDEKAKPLEFTVKNPRSATDGAGVMASIGLESPDLYLAGFSLKDSPAEKAGLKIGDKLVAIDGKPMHDFEDVSGAVRAFPIDSAAPMQIKYLRDGKEGEVSLKPKSQSRMNQAAYKEETHFEIGIKPMIIDAIPAQVDWKAPNMVAGLAHGWQQTVQWTSMTVLGFVRLFEARVSPKNIGGFFSIGAMAKHSWQMGLGYFLRVMAIISLNLFVLNLLPVPVLDGGHLVFFSIEAIRGAPLSLRKLEIAQQVGMVLLLGLMVFALYNDVSRMFLN